MSEDRSRAQFRSQGVSLILLLLFSLMGLACDRAPDGWTRLTLEADLSEVNPLEHDAVLDQSVEIIQKRMKQYGIRDCEVRRLGEDQIVVILPGMSLSERGTGLINKTAVLELKLVAQQGEIVSSIQKLDEVLKARLAATADTTAAEEGITFLEGVDTSDATDEREYPFSYYLRSFQRGGLLVDKDDIPRLKTYLADPAVQAAIPRGYEYLWGADDIEYSEGARKGRVLYYVNSRVELSGKNLIDAEHEADQNRPGSFRVAFKLDRLGAGQFARVTERNVGRQLATILDNQVFLAPVIENRIGTGSGVITGDFTAEEANDITILLRAGALPCALRIVEEVTSLERYRE